jgi:hypothetical protein
VPDVLILRVVDGSFDIEIDRPSSGFGGEQFSGQSAEVIWLRRR